MEACESGSMFQTLPNTTVIYATTAADPDESSWGTYCPPEDVINGTEVGTCLGDLYSVNWMENTESSLIMFETIKTQYDVVKTLTNLSHVSEYGTKSFDKDPIGDFQGNGNQSDFDTVWRNWDDYNPPKISMDSRDVKYAYLKRQAEKLGTPEAIAALQKETDEIRFQDNYFKTLSEATVGRVYELGKEESLRETMRKYDGIDFPCLKSAISTYENTCTSLGEYGLKYARVFVNLCNSEFKQDLLVLIPQVCHEVMYSFSE
jgi:legumain